MTTATITADRYVCAIDNDTIRMVTKDYNMVSICDAVVRTHHTDYGDGIERVQHIAYTDVTDRPVSMWSGSAINKLIAAARKMMPDANWMAMTADDIAAYSSETITRRK